MSRARRPRARGTGSEITDEQMAWLRGGNGGAWVRAWRYCDSGAPPSPRELWASHGAQIVREYAKEYPGTRPDRWWFSAAPPEPRKRLGGTGTPMRPRLGGGEQQFYRGVPNEWITADCVAAYRRIGRPLDVPAIDEHDPPTFESEATYLRRLGLLLPGELRRLNAPDFEPVSIFSVLGFDETA